MDNTYPYTWEENTKEDQEYRAKFWTGHNSIGPHTMFSSPMNLNMPTPFIKNGLHKQIWNMKPRPDDVWICTYPKCGTTMAQELLWQMSHGCDVTSEESKANLFARVPFLEFGGLNGVCDCQGCIDTFDARPPFIKDGISIAENLTDPRIIKCHLPISMLPPSVLEISKVIVIARNPKDACVSFYHHEKLLPHHAFTGSFDDFAKFWIQGRASCSGDYFVHLKDSLKHRQSKKVFMYWYEDILADFEGKVNELAEFTGFKVSDEHMKVLKEHMHIDNFRKNDAVNLKPPKGVVPDEVRDNFDFIRKGKVGDWRSHFTSKELLDEFDAYIEKNIKGANGELIEGIKYTGLD